MDCKCHSITAMRTRSGEEEQQNTFIPLRNDHMPFLIHDLSEQRSCCLPLTEHWPGRSGILMDPSLDDQRAGAFHSQSLSASSEAHGRSVRVRARAPMS